MTEIVPFDEIAARAAGVLCGRSGTSDGTDAAVVVGAREHRQGVVTGDPDDLRRIDPAPNLFSPD